MQLISTLRSGVLGACLLSIGVVTPKLTAQTLVEIEPAGVLTQGTLDVIFAIGGFGISAKNDIEIFNVRYTMENFEGGIDTVSGRMARPSGATKRYPVLVYMHGTTQTKFDVPSRNSAEANLVNAGASQGYVTISPDYLNMGSDPDGFHPYVHARSEGLSGIRMVEALKSSPSVGDVTNEQLFLTGYSQGGHASMAMHELLIEEFTDIEVTAAAHMSGPYSVSEIMADSVILKDETFFALDFLPYVVLGYQAVYPELEDDLTKLFRAPYIPIIERFRDQWGQATVRRDSLRNELLRQYVATEGNQTFYPYLLLTPEFANTLRKDEDDPYNVVLRENDTWDFVNPTPTRLLYCRADDLVNFRNSILAQDSMNALGADNTLAVNVDNDANHGQCVLPAVRAMLEFFGTYQTIVSDVAVVDDAEWTYVQTAGALRVYTDDEQTYRLDLVDAIGRTVVSTTYRSGQEVPLAAVPAGMAVVRLTDAEGRTATRKLVLR